MCFKSVVNSLRNNYRRALSLHLPFAQCISSWEYTAKCILFENTLWTVHLSSRKSVFQDSFFRWSRSWTSFVLYSCRQKSSNLGKLCHDIIETSKKLQTIQVLRKSHFKLVELANKTSDIWSECGRNLHWAKSRPELTTKHWCTSTGGAKAPGVKELIGWIYTALDNSWWLIDSFKNTYQQATELHLNRIRLDLLCTLLSN